MGIFSHISLIIQLSALKINKCVKIIKTVSGTQASQTPFKLTVMKKETVPEASASNKVSYFNFSKFISTPHQSFPTTNVDNS